MQPACQRPVPSGQRVLPEPVLPASQRRELQEPEPREPELPQRLPEPGLVLTAPVQQVPQPGAGRGYRPVQRAWSRPARQAWNRPVRPAWNRTPGRRREAS